jgi:hypothetical protein
MRKSIVTFLLKISWTAALIGGIGFAALSVRAQQPPAIEPAAAAILKASCDALSRARTMSFVAVDTYERAAISGQPLFYTIESKVTLQRPDKLRVIKIGDGIPDEFYYDGKTMTAYVPSANLVATAEAPPTIDEMLDAAWYAAAIYFPFADVIVSNPCDVFEKSMKSAFYVGQSVAVGGTTTDMVAVTGEGVQGEIWIGAADHLPRMVRVNYPDEPRHAHYQTDYSNWQINMVVEPTEFRSEQAASAVRMRFQPPGAGRPRPQPRQESPRQP